MLRILVVALAISVTGNSILAQQNDGANVGHPLTIPGRPLVIEMSGKLASEYARLTATRAEKERLDGLHVSVIATIAQQLDDGRIRFEHSANLIREGKPRLITLTGTADAARITVGVTPRGTLVYASLSSCHSRRRAMSRAVET